VGARGAFDPDEVERERGVVLEEWRLGRGAGARIRDQQFPVLFQGSRYAERLPIGTLATIEKAPRERCSASIVTGTGPTSWR
jgi:zinc protease